MRACDRSGCSFFSSLTLHKQNKTCVCLAGSHPHVISVLNWYTLIVIQVYVCVRLLPLLCKPKAWRVTYPVCAVCALVTSAHLLSPWWIWRAGSPSAVWSARWCSGCRAPRTWTRSRAEHGKKPWPTLWGGKKRRFVIYSPGGQIHILKDRKVRCGELGWDCDSSSRQINTCIYTGLVFLKHIKFPSQRLVVTSRLRLHLLRNRLKCPVLKRKWRLLRWWGRGRFSHRTSGATGLSDSDRKQRPLTLQHKVRMIFHHVEWV